MSTPQSLAPFVTSLVMTIAESVLYGYSVLLFTNVLQVLYAKRSHSKVNYTTVGIIITLFILSTGHFASSIFIAYRQLVFRETYVVLTGSVKVCNTTFHTIQTVLADAVVIYRAWIAYNKSLLPVLAPMFIWLGVLCTAIGSVIALAQAQLSAGSLRSANNLDQWVTAFISSTLTCNLVGTSLLIYRIWTVRRATRDYRIGGGPLSYIIRIVLDSAAIYSLALIAQIICSSLNSRGQFILLSILPQLIAITFYLVIVRMAALSNTPPNSSGGGTWGGSLFASDRQSGRPSAPIQLAPRSSHHDASTAVRSITLSKPGDHADYSSDDPEIGQRKGTF